MAVTTRAKSPSRAEAIAKALKPGPVFNTGVLLGNWVEDRIECPKRGTLYFPPKEVLDYEKLKPKIRQLDFRQNKLSGLQITMDKSSNEQINSQPTSSLFVKYAVYEPVERDRAHPLCPVHYETSGNIGSKPPDSYSGEPCLAVDRLWVAANQTGLPIGNVCSVIRQDSHDACGNYASTTDLVYNHLPKPLCGPDRRYYKRSAHQFYPQPDLMKCFFSLPQIIGMPIGMPESRFSGYKPLSIPREKSFSRYLTDGNVTEWGLREYLQAEWACTDVSDYASTLYEDTYVPPLPHQYLQRCERKARDSSFTKSFRFKMTKSKQ